MRRIDPSTGVVRLRDAWRALELRWEATRAEWDDPVSQRFEEDYLQTLEPRVRAAMNAMNSLLQVLAKAQQECE